MGHAMESVEEPTLRKRSLGRELLQKNRRLALES